MSTSRPILILMLFATALAAGTAGAVNSQAAAAPPAGPAAIPVIDPATLAALAARIPGAKAADLRATPVPGIFEYRKGAELAYVTADGHYAFAGDLYELDSHANLSDTRRRELRAAMVRGEPESSMLIFEPKDPKTVRYTVTVFTDVDCGYCRALHRQIADYNRLGIRVRYLAFPRSGPNTDSWTRAEQVWCASDRRAALTDAKLGHALSNAVCRPNPVAEQYAMGKAIGLTGTPGIVTGSGELLAGYLPPQALLETLESDPLNAAAH